jgi:hypothetical protein
MGPATAEGGEHQKEKTYFYTFHKAIFYLDALVEL